MKKAFQFLGILTLCVFLISVLCQCGLALYPGQPGVVTNNYSKIDVEFLEQPGLYVYEVVYNNSPGGEGVGAIITKLYPGARTYTSNVRTNADGSLYKVKGQYEGAEVQMISIPKLNQIYLTPQAQIELLVEEEMSTNEVDDRNLAEEKIFIGPKEQAVFPDFRAFQRRKALLDMFRFGTLKSNGSLSYLVSAVEIGGQQFIPSSQVHVEAGFMNQSFQTNLTQEVRKEFRDFLEKHFPKGYQGGIKFILAGGKGSISLSLGLHTIKTAKAAGLKIIDQASEEMVRKVLEDIEHKGSPKNNFTFWPAYRG